MMSHDRRQTALPRPRLGEIPRLAVTLLVLAAFFFQSYVCQSHFHAPAPGRTHTAGGNAGLALGSPAQDRDQHKAPGGDDPAHCPLCQAAIHSGSFVLSSPAAARAPSAYVFVSFLAAPSATARQAASHPWQSRAPPSI